MGKRILAIIIACIILSAFSGCQQQNVSASNDVNNAEGSSSADAATVLIGKVTAIDGSTVTLELGTLSETPALPADTQNNGGQPPSMPSGETRSNGGQPPAMPSGETGSNGGQPPAMPPGSRQQGNPLNGAMGTFTSSGETKTITLTTGINVLVESMSMSKTGSVSDITIGSILSVKLSKGTVTEITVKMTGGAPGGQPPGGNMQDAGVTLSGSYAVDGTKQTSEGKSYSSTKSNECTVLVTNGGTLTLTGGTLEKTGNSSNVDQSNFSGLNAIFTANRNSTATISGTVLNSSAEGANAIFSTGEKTVVTAENITIHTKGNSSRGLDATYGGTINATNVDITTEGAHCAAVATDRGEGTVVVTGGTLLVAGDGSPCVYSTGNISLKDVTGKATGSQAAVIEGKNSITLEDCNLTGAGLNGIMLYQSTSGDAAEGTSKLITKNSTIKTTSAGPMFYVTNTQSEATLTNTVLEFSSGILANVAGNNTNNWGTPGSNGGTFTLTGINQTFKGAINCDKISKVSLILTQSSVYTGAVNADNTAKEASVSLDASSSWNVTGTSYVSSLTNAQTDCSNIQSNGNTIYYDASNSGNAWLGGKTISLSGGGSLKPKA